MRTRCTIAASALIGVLWLFAGCDKSRENQPPTPPVAAPPEVVALTGPPEITAETEEGFVDLLFYIAEHQSLADGSHSLVAAGRHKGRAVGFQVVVGTTWTKGKPDKDVPVDIRPGAVLYRSIGAESDAFLQVLDDLYGTKVHPKAMVGERRFAAISLSGDPKNLAAGPVKIKLFYEPGPDDRYAEFFTNIDLARRRLEFREKDPEYRKPVVRALQRD